MISPAEAWANIYEKRRSSPYLYRKSAEKFVRNLPLLENAKSVLDIGCGYGDVLIAIKRQNPAISCVGIDVAENVIASNRERHKGISWGIFDITRSLEELFQNHSIDIIIAKQTLGFIADPLPLIFRLWKRAELYFVFTLAERQPTEEEMARNTVLYNPEVFQYQVKGSSIITAKSLFDHYPSMPITWETISRINYYFGWGDKGLELMSEVMK